MYDMYDMVLCAICVVIWRTRRAPVICRCMFQARPGNQPSVARLVRMPRKLHLKQLRKTELDRCTFPDLIAQYRRFEGRIRSVRNAHARGALTEAQRDTSIESLQREKNACVDDIRKKTPRRVRVRPRRSPLWHVLALLTSKPESQVLLEKFQARFGPTGLNLEGAVRVLQKMRPRRESLSSRSKLFHFEGEENIHMTWNEAVLYYTQATLSFFAGAVQLYAEADVAESAAGRALEILRSLGACDSPANIDGKDAWAGMVGELEFKERSEASRHIWQKLADDFGGFPEGFGAEWVAHADLDTALPRRRE